MMYIKLFEHYLQASAESVRYPKLGVKTEDAFTLIDYRDSFRDLYPGYEDDAAWADEDTDYFYQSKEGAYREVNDVLDILESLPDEIPVYRTISVKSLVDVDRDNLGECWSYQKSSALEFGSHIGATALLSGTIASEFIDWWATIRLHFQFSGSQMSDDENEVRVDYPEEVQNLKIEWIGKNPSV